jgi:hypothetical protein
MSTTARNTLDAIPSDELITLVYHNGQAETTMKARELKEEMRGDPFRDTKKDWVRPSHHVSHHEQGSKLP